MIGMALCLSGCAGFVGGDLRNTKSDCMMLSCKSTNTEYQIRFNSDAKNDYGNRNVAGIVSSLGLGIIPTYWTTSVNSEATIFHNGTAVYCAKYKSRIHLFYGILWAVILPSPSQSTNALQVDEGNGIEIVWGIRDRTLNKVITDYGVKMDQCYLSNDDAPETTLEPATH